MKLKSNIRDKILKLFKELDVPAPGVGWWKLCSDKKIVEYYDRYVRGITLCDGCACEKKVLRNEIDDELFEGIVLGESNEGVADTKTDT